MLTPEAIEAAAKALYDLEPWQIASYSTDTYAWKALTPSDRSNYYRTATAALSAAYPLIEAQAKAEALREAAGELSGVCADFAYMRADGLIEYATPEDWLLARAETIEGKSK